MIWIGGWSVLAALCIWAYQLFFWLSQGTSPSVTCFDMLYYFGVDALAHDYRVLGQSIGPLLHTPVSIVLLIVGLALFAAGIWRDSRHSEQQRVRRALARSYLWD